MRSSLEDLARCFRGCAREDADWSGLLTLANRSLVTAHLALALEGATGVPEPVRAFSEEVLRRNRLRNARLTAQLGGVLRTLNAAGIEPVLLKGAAGLAGGGRGRREGRILCDLDILVQPVEAPEALLALERDGYAPLSRRDGREVHAVAELARPGEMATIDLHQRPPGPPAMAETAGLRMRAQSVDIEGGRALTPDAATQVYLVMLHDQFHDGDYWSGRLNLRHLLDVHDLIEEPAGVDWGRMEALVQSPLVENALDTLLAGAAWLTGCPAPAERIGRLLPRLQHARRRLQVRAPGAAMPLACATMLLEAPNIVAHGRINRQGRERLFGSGDSRRPLGVEARLARVRDIFAAPAMGKL